MAKLRNACATDLIGWLWTGLIEEISLDRRIWPFGCGEAVAALLRCEVGERLPDAAHRSGTVRAALVRRRRLILAKIC